MKMKDTRMQIGGVLRCCFCADDEMLERDCEMGDTRICQYCKREFELRDNQGTPTWEPTDMFEKEAQNDTTK
jgi:hypothetical protein